MRSVLAVRAAVGGNLGGDCETQEGSDMISPRISSTRGDLGAETLRRELLALDAKIPAAIKFLSPSGAQRVNHEEEPKP
jgi:hypothetical protein